MCLLLVLAITSPTLYPSSCGEGTLSFHFPFTVTSTLSKSCAVKGFCDLNVFNCLQRAYSDLQVQ